MLERSDVDFATSLDAFIMSVLNGTEAEPGLYFTLPNSQTWDQFIRTASRIQAFREIRDQMRTIARKLNGDQSARNQVDRELN